MHMLFIQGSPSMVRMVVVLLPALCGLATPVPLATSSDSKVMNKKKYYVAHSMRQKHACCFALAVPFRTLNQVIPSLEWNVLWDIFILRKSPRTDALPYSWIDRKSMT